MINDGDSDVPYGEDFHDPATAVAWAEAAGRKRPWRATIFDHFVSIVGSRSAPAVKVLELGSGPGFLAEQVLTRCPSVGEYTLLDFAAPMLEQSRMRLARHASRARLLQADFKADTWASALDGPFDFVLSLQAVHELRHKRHAERLYRQILPILTPGGEVLVCDHLPEGAHTPLHRVLYLSLSENLATFERAGYRNAEIVWTDHQMAFYRACT
jgi:ubiquinone/menaquinone biosynthesis C-methylase UbiE